MAVTFQNASLQSIYNQSTLANFRSGITAADISGDLESLERRIESFEFVLLPTTSGAQSSADYPYDREGLRREFLDEVLAILIRRNLVAPAITDPTLLTTTPVLVTSTPAQGGNQTDLNKLFTPNGVSYAGNFANLIAANGADNRTALLSASGQSIFNAYGSLIDAVFNQGNTLGQNPARPVQNVSGIQPLLIDGHIYDRAAQVSGFDSATNLPSFDTYLLEAGVEDSHVVKDAAGNVTVTGPATTNSLRLQLNPVQATFNATNNDYEATVDIFNFGVIATPTGVSFRINNSDPYTPAEAISPVMMNVPGRGNEFPTVYISSSFRATMPNGSSYLIGLSNEGKVYITSLTASHLGVVGTTASLSGMEYLYYYNEARIKILRGKLAYNEAVVREIQEDLRQANEALSELETQSGAVVATNSDGTLTGQVSAETFKMNLFNATASTAGKPIFSTAGNDSVHTSAEWQQNRTNLKNYIDRRSAEAQQATLDYQNTLNRFNNAFEVMAKLQEKLDTLLKAQLRNLS